MIKKEIISVIIFILIIINFTGCTEEKEEENNTYSTLYVDSNGGANYIKIQDAINDIEVGGTIYVRNGFYNEILKIDKTIDLIGDIENSAKISYTFNEGVDNVNGVVTISADNCTFTGFDIYFGSFVSNIKGIYITSSNNTINSCNITNVYQGIFLDYTAKNNDILNCTISNTKRGIYVNRSDFNFISNNIVTQTGLYSIFLYGSNENILSENMVVDNDFGIYAQGSDNNLFYNNTLKNNSGGLKFCCGSTNNVVYNNNFIENYLYNARDDVNNQWDNGILGNYWDDYQGKYPNAKQIEKIWDTPYAICDEDDNCEDVFDRYPLVSEISQQ